MKRNLNLTLLKKRNQYLFQLLVISILIIMFNITEFSSCMDSVPENIAVQNVSAAASVVQPLNSDEVSSRLLARVLLTTGALLGGIVIGIPLMPVGIALLPVGIYYVVAPLAYPVEIPSKLSTLSRMQEELANSQSSLLDQITAMERTMTSIEQHLDSRLISPVKPCEPCETVFYKVLEDTTLWETFINIFPIYSFLFVLGLGIFFYKIKLKQR